MHTRIHALLGWSPADPATRPDLLPAERLDTLGDLMAHHRGVTPAFRPRGFETLSSADRARIDGLIAAVLVLDGLMDAREDRLAGRPLRLPVDELDELKITDAHLLDARVDFALRRMAERYGQRIRKLMQGAAPLGRPWLGGWRYRLTIARVEQLLRARQVDPALWFDPQKTPGLMDRPMASARIAWRVLTGRG